MKEKVILTSKINKYLGSRIIVDFYAVTISNFTNEEKGRAIHLLLNKYNIPHMLLGHGTNRIGVQVNDVVFKIALDNAGMIDNMREYKYTDKLQPHVIKVYESTHDGMVIACEPVIPMSRKDFIDNKHEILSVLKTISDVFFIGDIGYDPDKNYANWGFRKGTNQIVILDFAYIYRRDFRAFTCSCNKDAFLVYNDTYTHLVCNDCNRIYPFSKIRQRISKEAEAEELKDTFDGQYVVKGPEAVLDKLPNATLTQNQNREQRRREEKKRLKKEKEMKRKENWKKLNSDIPQLPKVLSWQELVAKAKSMGIDTPGK